MTKISISNNVSRNPLFDNIKALLILLVVFAHVLEEFSMEGTYGHVRAIIYSFHMPAFIFVSGYFSKNVKKCYEQAMEKCLLPFLVFNTIWIVAIYQYPLKLWNVFVPAYTFWYLLSLFWWRITLPAMKKVRFALPILFVVALYIGCFHEADRFLSVSRTLVYYPFFLLGHYIKSDQIEKLRRIRKVWGFLLLALGLGTALFMSVKNYIPVRAYENLQCYACTELGEWKGMAIRAGNMAIALIVIIAIILLMPEKEYKVTVLGKRTITIYLLSNFFVVGVGKLWNLFDKNQMLLESSILIFAVAILVTGIITYVCSRRLLCKAYENFFAKLGQVL